MEEKERKDEWAIVLEYLPHGHASEGGKPEPVAQVVGENYFSLLEIVPREDATLALGDRVYIGEGNRERVKYIKRALDHSDLTSAAQSELEEVIEDIVREAEERFVDFFNDAQPITTRMHSLELLPGIGKKHMWDIIEERDVEPFQSYEDLKERCPSIPEPQKMVRQRILEEIKERDPRHTIFVKAKGSKRD